jgi:hypothetical protein
MDHTVFTTLAILINLSHPAFDRALSTWRHLATFDAHECRSESAVVAGNEMSLRHVLT